MLTEHRGIPLSISSVGQLTTGSAEGESGLRVNQSPRAVLSCWQWLLTVYAPTKANLRALQRRNLQILHPFNIYPTPSLFYSNISSSHFFHDRYSIESMNYACWVFSKPWKFDTLKNCYLLYLWRLKCPLFQNEIHLDVSKNCPKIFDESFEDVCWSPWREEHSE